MAALVAACDRTYVDWAPEGWQLPDSDGELDRCRRWVAEPERWSVGVFDRDGQLVGLASVRQASDPEDVAIAGAGHLTALFVNPDRWRQGIASHLLGEAENAMRGRGWSRAMLWTPVGAPAERFYEANGWIASDHTEYLEVIAMRVSRYEKNLNPSGGDAATC